MINGANQENSEWFINNSNADICCGHLEVDGFEVTPGMKFQGGRAIKDFHRFDRVWSGHFHHRSKKSNVQYLGNPYQMYWNDYKDPRGFHIYDTETDRLTYHKNPFEIFTKIYYNDVERSYNNFDYNEHKDTFVKIIVEEKRDYAQYETLLDNLYHVGVHDIKTVETLVDTDDSDSDIEVKDTLTLLNEYIDDVDISVDKTDLKQLMQTLYIESCEVV